MLFSFVYVGISLHSSKENITISDFIIKAIFLIIFAQFICPILLAMDINDINEKLDKIIKNNNNLNGN